MTLYSLKYNTKYQYNCCQNFLKIILQVMLQVDSILSKKSRSSYLKVQFSPPCVNLRTPHFFLGLICHQENQDKAKPKSQVVCKTQLR